MPRLRLLESAQEDLDAIFWYLAVESRSAAIAERFVRSLRDKCAALAALPGTLGVARPELRPDLRSFPFKGYVIFFRYVDDAFEVVHILEGHRDIIAHFTSRDET